MHTSNCKPIEASIGRLYNSRGKVNTWSFTNSEVVRNVAVDGSQCCYIARKRTLEGNRRTEMRNNKLLINIYRRNVPTIRSKDTWQLSSPSHYLFPTWLFRNEIWKFPCRSLVWHRVTNSPSTNTQCIRINNSHAHCVQSFCVFVSC